MPALEHLGQFSCSGFGVAKQNPQKRGPGRTRPLSCQPRVRWVSGWRSSLGGGFDSSEVRFFAEGLGSALWVVWGSNKVNRHIALGCCTVLAALIATLRHLFLSLPSAFCRMHACGSSPFQWAQCLCAAPSIPRLHFSPIHLQP